MKQSRFKTIVVGLDFSQGSKQAYLRALDLGKKWKAKVLLVHIYRRIPDSSFALFERNELQLKKELTAKLIRHYRVPESLQKDIVVKVGNPENEMVNLAKKHRSSLIVIAASGSATLFSRFMLGSTAERIAVTSSVPVWIQKGLNLKIKEVLIPFDLSGNSNHLLNWSEDFMFNFKAKLSAVFVQTPITPILDYATWSAIADKIETENKKQFDKLKRKHKKLKFHMLEGDAAIQLTEMSKQADLVIIAPHKSPPIFPTFGSVSAKVVRKSPGSVLIVPMD